MESKGLTLNLGEDSEHLGQSNPFEHFFNRAFVSCSFRAWAAQFVSNVFQIDLGIKMS